MNVGNNLCYNLLICVEGCIPFGDGVCPSEPKFPKHIKYPRRVKNWKHKAQYLGCQHDGDGPSDWVKGHIGSADCPWDDGYLMSYKMQDERQYQFSYCCQREVRNLYK
ncbi:hypothetical protein IscW_ISCW006734 [Ixodes scapularis]|uniref:Uncharacterized protein n=1 Tax=Ixodes scapularis TaxID=6945 RepID=B7PQH4_IXOSC|nr:hypothetical protein IscW_ISCW006734 [Ixodes scapularis]|eukprot:XP_002436016.1 hypothetical protein IscW_ISCW006734 [Ixodes scapularis]